MHAVCNHPPEEKLSPRLQLLLEESILVGLIQGTQPPRPRILAQASAQRLPCIAQGPVVGHTAPGTLGAQGACGQMGKWKGAGGERISAGRL